MLCLGRPGLGKTRIGKAIAHAACLAGYSTLCVGTAEMLEERTDGESTHPCDRARLASNIGFAQLLIAEQAAARQEQPTSLSSAVANLDQAIVQQSTTCKDKYHVVSSLSDRARADILAGDLASAQTHVDRLRAVAKEMTGDQVIDALEVGARLALTRGDYALALKEYRHIASLASASAKAFEVWRASVGIAESLEGLGKTRDALAAYADAEYVLDAAALNVPLEQGRGVFVSQLERGARNRIDLLVRSGTPAQALAVARQSRGRVLARLQYHDRLPSLSVDERKRWDDAVATYLEERDGIDRDAEKDWELEPKELERRRASRASREQRIRGALDEALSVLANPSPMQPSPPPPGVLLWTAHPVRRGWVAFAADASSTHVARLPALPDLKRPEELAAALLEPFRPQIEAASRIRIMPYGALRGVDFHALRWNDAPLIATMAVEYALDLAADSPATPEPGKPVALIVTDPANNLPAARAEGARIAELLHGGTWETTWLRGDEATKQSFLAQLSRATLLHYAGHGLYKGYDGWESVLPLAHHTNLTVGDILAQRTVPPHIILSACESARSYEGVGVESLGIAQAFMTAGAQAVVAPVRNVDDRLAAEVSLGLHQTLAKGGAIDLPAALQQVQQSIAKSGRAVDWQAYRVLTR